MPDGVRKIDPKSDPRRRCRKLAEWPEADRAAWHAAVAEGGLLEGSGPAAGWRATTRKSVQDAYGRWLTFLAPNGWLDPDAGPADRLTPERLRAFIAELEKEVSPVTLRNRITNLAEALRVSARSGLPLASACSRSAEGARQNPPATSAGRSCPSASCSCSASG